MATIASELMDQFKRDGYIVLEDFITSEKCDELASCLRETITKDLDMTTHPKSVFSTKSPAWDSYFLESQDKVRFFFEEGVLDEGGKLNRDKELSVNKIGHGLHLVGGFKEVTHSQKMQELARKLDFVEPVVVQSMAIFKQPHIGGAVPPHQDGTYLMTSPSKVTGLWIALEDAELDNGCLWFIPGSQSKPTELKWVRNTSKDGPVAVNTGEDIVYNDEDFIAVPIKKGSAIVIHGHVAHKSKKNLSDRSRLIYTFHIAETHETEWSEKNWLQPSAEYAFPKLYTC